MLWNKWLNPQSGLRVLLGVAILYYVYSLVGVDFRVNEAFTKVGYERIAIALTLFLISFFLKFQRLAVIIGSLDSGIVVGSMQRLLSAHINSSILSIVLPFKLGDVARVLLLQRCNQTYMASLGIVAFERILDLAVVSALVLLVGSTFSFLTMLDGLMVASRVAAVVSFLLFAYVGYRTIEFWHSIFLRHNFLFIGPAMIAAEHLMFAARVARDILSNQGFLLVVLTLVIWILEASAFLLIFSYHSFDASLIFFLGLVSFIAFGLPAGPVGFGPIQLVFYFAFSLGLMPTDVSQDGIFYSIFLYLPAVLIFGVLALLITKRRRVVR